jgi:hypothetical protein
VPWVILSAQTTEKIMDLEALLANLDAFKARLDTLETELAAKDAELEKVTQNRDSILREKRALEGRPVDFDAMDRRIRESAMPPVREHTLSREEARSGTRYREAKAAAEAAGVPLRIVDERQPVRTERRSSPVKLVHDEDGGVLHANIALVEKHGQQRMRQLAADKGATLRVFRSVDDLPRDAAARHAQIIADRAPGTLLEGNQ